ncbi:MULTISPECIES: TetR/AcrR family transcriptional regulator [Streptomyces]|uniref:TetR/AcrR family transcriptional regulator n=1 Tax=Streptomyces TaxID=1883 RepID=UPI001162F4CF|nr:TetR/AcrR family transcriptional regulator [Streptomyces sp. S1A1-7]QDN74482.1 TetR/AcrR family transcriptional regulator [Streptomyces sp. S1A1-7]
MSGRTKVDDAPQRLVRAAISLLAEQGPSAVKARTVASASGLSTMVVYSHFGGIPELMRAVVDHGFKELGAAFAQVPVTEDPIADLFAMALSCRRVARENPHLYDLMFGLSTRATYRPLSDADLRLSGRSPAFRDAHAHVTAACERLVHSGRVERQEPEVIAAQLWSLVHGYITLELAEHFVEFDDAVVQVLLPMGVNFSVGLGDKRERAEASHEVGARLYDSIVQGQGK